MSLLLRRVIFYTIALVFIVTAPLIIAYTTGYRYSFSQHRIVKVGAILITSTPQGASIILNGESSGTTPALLSNIKPGLYEIRVERPDYFPWSKTLPVESETTTFAHGIPLFKNNPPTLSDTKALPSPQPSASETHAVTFVLDSSKSKIQVREKNVLIAELEGDHAIWKSGTTPTLITYSSHEVWQYDPALHTTALVTRLVEPIREVIPLTDREGLLLILADRVRALELDTRNRQNAWDLALFSEIKNAALNGDGQSLLIEGTRDKQAGVWKLEL